MKDRITEVFPSLKEVTVSFDMARCLQSGALVDPDISSPIAVGPGSTSLFPQVILVQLGQDHSSITTRSLGNSFRLLGVHNVELRGASLIHCLTRSSCTINLIFRSIGPMMIASPGPRAPFFRLRSQPQVAGNFAGSGAVSLLRMTPLFS